MHVGPVSDVDVRADSPTRHARTSILCATYGALDGSALGRARHHEFRSTPRDYPHAGLATDHVSNRAPDNSNDHDRVELMPPTAPSPRMLRSRALRSLIKFSYHCPFPNSGIKLGIDPVHHC